MVTQSGNSNLESIHSDKTSQSLQRDLIRAFILFFLNSALDESDFDPQRLFLQRRRRRRGFEDFIFWCIECRRKLHHPLHPFCPRGLGVILLQKTHHPIRPLFPPVATCGSLTLESDGKVPL